MNRIFFSIITLIAATLLLHTRSYCQCSLTSSTGSFSICVGSSITATATGACGSGTITWTSSNTGVATVSGSSSASETVTAVAAGTSDIKYLVGGVVFASKIVTVNALPTPVASGPSNVCASGPTVTLNPAPAGGTFSASNANASVTLSTGIVTGSVVGTVVITYTYTDANGCTAATTHPMTVDGTPSAGVLSGTQMIWTGGGASVTFTSTAGGGVWSSANTGIATAGSASGMVAGVSAGATTISYAVTNACGTAYATRTVTVNPYATAGNNSFATVSGVSATCTMNGLNTAMLNGNNTLQILAFAWDDGTSKYVQAYDVLTTKSVTPTPTGATGTPDVVIGNGPGGADDYILAVAYPTTSGVTVDCYDITADGSNFLLNPTPVTFTYSCSCSVNTVHIDGIADYTNYGPTYPNIVNAIVTWDDAYAGTVYVAPVNLQASSGGSLSATVVDYGKDPDVAAVSRGTGTNVDWALVTYVDATNTTLYYADVDMSGPTPSASLALDITGGGTLIYKPRIDAIDDYNVNDPTASIAIYKVAAEVYNAGTSLSEIRTYDNLLGGMSYWASSDVVNVDPITANPPPYNHYAPTVALASGDYMVPHFTDDGGGNDVVMMEPITLASSTTLGGGADYWVSQTSAMSTGGMYVSSSSQNANDPTNCGLVAWAYPDGNTIGCGLRLGIYYKITPYPYYFKPGRNTGVSGREQKIWRVYPNPATDQLVIAAAAGGAGSYEIMDMTGRVWLQGRQATGTQQVSIVALPAGSYIVKLHGDNGASGAELVVKE